MSLWLLLAPALAVSTPSEIPDPRATDTWLVDQANIVDDAAEKRLNEELLGVLQEKGVEVLVVTLDTVAGDPGAFAQGLFREWSPGRVNQDRGVLVMLVVDSKALAVNAGIGLAADLTDPWIQQMQAEVMVPKLASGDVTGAIEASIGAIRDQIGASSRTSELPPDEGEALDILPLWAWIALAGLGVLGLIVAGVKMASPDDDDELPPDLGVGPDSRRT